MAGILLCWAVLPSEATEWYEETYIPSMRNKWAIHVLHCEETTNGMEEESIGKLDCPWPLMTVYEMSNIAEITKATYDKTNHPPEELFSGLLKDARFDVRTYKELRRWQNEEWDEDDVSQIVSVAAMEWRVRDDVHDEVLQFYTSRAAPTIASSPAVLRFRLFQVDNATVLQGNSYVTEDKEKLHTYFTMVELDIEQWPWDVVLELAEIPEWKEYFEKQEAVTWQVSHYLVKKMYPGDGLIYSAGESAQESAEMSSVESAEESAGESLDESAEESAGELEDGAVYSDSESRSMGAPSDHAF